VVKAGLASDTPVKICDKCVAPLKGWGFGSHLFRLISKPIELERLIEQPCFDGPGCHPFRSLPDLSGFPPIIVRWLG
jgi:hypothetical protein